jgi:hypothetical protein
VGDHAGILGAVVFGASGEESENDTFLRLKTRWLAGWSVGQSLENLYLMNLRAGQGSNWID